MAAKKNKLDVYQTVTDRFIASLQDNKIPWKKPWNPLGAHRNYISKKAYRGINPLLLDLTVSDKGYESPYWLTFKQADSLSCAAWCKKNKVKNDKEGYKKYKAECRNKDSDAYTGVRDGEKSTLITYWNTFVGEDPNKVDENGNPKEKIIPYLKYIYVFNTEQTDLDIKFDKSEEIEFNSIERAEKIIEEYEDKPEIKHSGDRAYYRPSTDIITMPKPESFHSEEEYYKTLFHECIHSTGAESRLKRIFGDDFGDEKYSKEELIAEIGATFLTNLCEIDTDEMQTNSTAYINGWISKLESDPKLIVQAGGKAQKATDLILGEEYQPPEEIKTNEESGE